MQIKAPHPRGLLAARLFTKSSGHMGKNMQKPETKGTTGLVRLNQAKLRVRAINTSRPCPNTKVYALTASYTSRPFCHALLDIYGPSFLHIPPI